MLQFDNPKNRSQGMIFKLLLVQALRANPDETPPAEILKQVIARISLASELRQTTQVLGPLITDIETFPEEDMNDLDSIDIQVVVDETGFDQ